MLPIIVIILGYDKTIENNLKGELMMKDQDKKMFKEEIGWVPPGVKLAEHFGEAFQNRLADYHHEIWGESEIPLKYRYLIALATAIATGHEKRSVLELRKAINAGATKAEVIDTLKQQVWMFGSPTLVSIAPLFEMIEKSYK